MQLTGDSVEYGGHGFTAGNDPMLPVGAAQSGPPAGPPQPPQPPGQLSPPGPPPPGASPTYRSPEGK